MTKWEAWPAFSPVTKDGYRVAHGAWTCATCKAEPHHPCIPALHPAGTFQRASIADRAYVYGLRARTPFGRLAARILERMTR